MPVTFPFNLIERDKRHIDVELHNSLRSIGIEAASGPSMDRDILTVQVYRSGAETW